MWRGLDGAGNTTEYFPVAGLVSILSRTVMTETVPVPPRNQIIYMSLADGSQCDLKVVDDSPVEFHVVEVNIHGSPSVRAG